MALVLQALPAAVVGKLTEMLINKVLVKQCSYVFCFTSNLDEFRKATESLKQAQNRTENDVQRAHLNAEDIEQDVRQWQDEVEKILNEIQILEEETNETKGCFLWDNFKYRLSRKLKKKTVQIVNLTNKPISNPVGRRVDLPPIEFSEVELNFSVSSKTVFDHIIDWLKMDEVQTIGLYGMGGVGKTTLVQQIGHAAKERKLFDKVLMVVFSQTPDVKKMQYKIAGELGLMFDDGNDETLRASQLLARLGQEKNMLIILDDVWNDSIKLKGIGIEFHTSKTSCKYIVTTRDSHVCTTMRCQEKVQLDTMTESEAWVLFKDKAGLDDDSSMKDTAVEIAEMCGGLPIAIVTLASALKDTSEYQWEDALEKLKCSKLLEIPNIYGDENVYRCFQLSYDRLESNDLKLFFSLCSLYPEDYEISGEDLTRLAATELDIYVNQPIEKKRTSVEAYIDTLIAKCLLIKCGKRRRKVKMHDMVRHFALRTLSNHENSESYVSGTYIDDSSDFPSDDRLAACQIISVMRHQNINMPSRINYENLRVLLVRGPYWLLSLSVGLKFEFSTNLRSLQLLHCTLLDDMSSLGCLKEIEILSFSGSKFTQLPDGISEMQRLKLLDLSSCWRLMKVPDDLLKKLLNLEELYTHGSHQLWGEERGYFKVSELKGLKNLKRLSLELEYTSLPRGFVFPKLKWYYIYISSNGNFKYHTDVELSSNTLKFVNVESTWKNVFVNLLPSVNDLEVEDRSGEIECIIPYMHQEGFNKLEDLNPELKEHTPVFSNLAKLELMFLPELRCLWPEPTPDASFKNLTEVSIVGCQSLTYVFSQSLAQSLIQLQKLKINGCIGLDHIIKEEDEIVISLDHNQTQCFRKVERLDISDCPKLEYIMSIAIARRLERLKYMSVSNNSRLTEIFGPEEEEGSPGAIVLPLLTILHYDKPDHISRVSFPSLRELDVGRLYKRDVNRLLDGKKLDHLRITIFAKTWYYVLAILVKQHLILINVCLYGIDELDQMFHMEGVGNEEPLSLVSIQSLTLQALSNLRDIWSGCIYTPNLTELKIEICDSLRSIFSPTLARNLPLLEELKICNCDKLEAIICEDNPGESDYPSPIYFPNLTQLEIRSCRSLRNIFSPTLARNLTYLEISLCPSLRYIFSPNLARNLPHLRECNIDYCDELEAIVGEDNHGESDHPNPTYFPSLERITIVSCDKLKYIFKIHATRNNELEGVFVGERDRDDTKSLELPLLKRLTLLNLPKLRSFSAVGYHFIFPCLDYTVSYGCYNMTTMFNTVSIGSAHVESKDDSVMPAPGLNVKIKKDEPKYLLHGSSSSSAPDATQEESRLL